MDGAPLHSPRLLARRGFLRAGAVAIPGLCLSEVFRRRALGEGVRDVSVIQLFLGGGPSHLDTYDPKPDAPAEYRGEFRAVPTRLPGVFLSELLPRQAGILDRVTVVRSLHHSTSDHSEGTHWAMTGHAPARATPRRNERPSVGAVVAALNGANRPGLPAYVTVPDAPAFAQASYLGPGNNPFGVGISGAGEAFTANLDLPPAMTFDRLADRRRLLARLDTLERQRDTRGLMAGQDRFTEEAFAVLTGRAARKALDLRLEPETVRERYGRTQVGAACLMARRLVEAGVTFVTVHEPGWDHHGQVFASCRRQLPAVDAAVAALVEDLFGRGLDRRVLLLVWGEFGRTPRVNGAAGRDHWPGAFSVLLAGGGLRAGQVIGSTGRRGEEPLDRPLRPEDVIHTVYSVLGIDPARTLPDESGRPRPLLEGGRPIPELLGG